MECKLFMLWLLPSFVFHLCICVDQASFYGSSHISLPFQEAKSSTDVHFRFRTLLPNALILLVAGTTDYCIVRLENGRIKININLGAGESELLSQHNFKLNDFKWHEVTITRREANLSMQVDKAPLVQKQLPGQFFELNIHYGLFIGGHGNFSEIFFGHLDNFRGCLSELSYNGVMVLEQARLRQLQSIVQRITWNCASEFEATFEQPISFVEDDAFMLLSRNFYSKEIKIQFDIKTKTTQSILFYNIGRGTKFDFFLIEIWKSNIRCIIKSESTNTEIVNNEYIADGHWHKVHVHISPTLIEISVDGKMKNEKNGHGHGFQLSENVYIGGLEVSKRSRAMSKGCKYCDATFKGCLKHIIISDVKVGLSDVTVSEGLLSGCVWHYPCGQNPCKDGSVCVQKGLDSFQCHCQEEFCVKHNFTEGYKVFSHNSLATDLELLSVEPLSVLEGQSAIVTTNNLYMILDYQKFGIKDSGINFYIVEGPMHGTIDTWPHEKKSFSLADILKDKVHYIHDGSEFYQDIVVLEVEFSPDKSFILPGYLQGRFRFSLSANIVPVNDLPLLSASESTVLRIVQGTKKPIDSDLFKVKDPDSPPEQIIYNIIKSDIGHFEHRNKEGIKINSFSQKEIEEKKIMFVHHSNSQNDSFISLQVSDGIETSPVTKIRVSVSPQYWRLENNTGLIVLHQTSAIITPFNLSFTSNVMGVDHKIQFHVVKKPSYGVIEVEKNMNVWESSEIFTNIDLKQHRVRYRHTTSKPEFDEFQFKLTLDKSSVYTFRLTFVKCSLTNVNTKSLLFLNETWEATLSSEYLSFHTQPIKTLPTSIHYVITSPPRYGYLFSSMSKYKLRSCDTFTQEDIQSQNIKYKFHQKPYSYVNDSFQFIVLSPGCKNLTHNFNIIYKPLDEVSLKVIFHSKPLIVDEGASETIDLTHLNIKSSIVTELVFNITQKPQFGVLQISSQNERNDSDFFTSKELKSRQVYYKHDGSETRHDGFLFSALSSNEQNFQYVGEFKIEINLKNDNSPVRAIDKVFHVVVGGERIVTGNDLKYSDADLDTTPAQIIYTCRESPNGNFYYVGNRTLKIKEFSQSDIDNNRILFRHKGPEYAKVRLWVTDGKFHVNGILEVQASAPFIHVHHKKKLIVQQSSLAVVTEESLSYATNVFASDIDVIFEVTSQPTSGRLVNTNNLKSLYNFTQADVVSGRVSYINEVSNSDADEIELTVRCKDAVNVAQLGVLILPSTYWEPLEIKSVNKLIVEESTSAIITKNILEISQINVPPSAIYYYITQPPENGYISTIPDSKRSDYEPSNVYYFTQDLINENRILYIQSAANQTRDKIVFNVTNGMVWQNDVTLRIEIIPEQIYLGSNNVTVNEGGVTTLSTSHLFILTDYYKSKSQVQYLQYAILQDARHGCIQIDKRCNKLNKFSHKKLLGGSISYAHDGSENLVDEIKLTAVVNQKRSNPVTLNVNVLPVNDQKPKLVNNTGLVMWEGGVEAITNSMLAAIDNDKPGDTLKYQVINSWWGSLALKSDLANSVNHFTQELINLGMIVFKNQDGREAKFTFNISDGLHTTEQYTFHIKTKPVQLQMHCRSLHIFPLQRKYITSSHLLTTISDPTRVVTYDVVTPPTLGRLMMESAETPGIYKVVSTFTQHDLNDSKVFYEHTHQFSDLYANDSFVFNVKAHLARSLHNQTLKIDISVSSGGLDAYVTIPKITVNEGGITTVPLNLSRVITFLENHAGIRSPIIHASASVPQHGVIFLQHNHNISTFTQQQLESGQVYYEHDHSDSLGDNIHFSLYLIPGYVILCNITVPISINPINDQPFNLVTPAPSLTVVQGENHTITRTELATEDADTPPSKIKYDIISGPHQGRLVLLPDRVPVTYFTQADIDNKLLVYIHNSSVLVDSFHFRVWDESFRPEFKLFNIIVLPIQINISAGLPVYLQQGSDVMFLSEKQFFIETNANQYKIRYTVKREPKRGVLYVQDAPSLVFTQNDLKNDYVMYLQTDMTAANDTFKVIGEIISGNTSVGNEVDVTIKVQPLMQIRNFTVITGEYNRLTLSVLDATPLAKLTNSNPRYTVIHLPTCIQVKKVIRSSGEKRHVLNTVITSFSHDEVQSGLIYLYVKNIELPWNGLQERLIFLLAASIFQPAVGELKLDIKSSISNEIHSTLAGPSDPAGHEGGLHFASPNMTRDYFLIVSMVAGVIILGVAVIVVIKCRSLEAEELKKEEECLQPIPLPRPPDRLLASPSPLKQHHLDGFTPPLPTALPQCKVTPLSRSELESHACYPYGVDEQHSDDWSSCEASDPTCPSKNIMLRRNQYWV
ncbi:Chondroitin sulfate proteoglycan 4-like Protein [Tribolium castaneum]|uniref:Chondroitin sulfate proteoglycan 4-like Protein n=1 Tax=Tribolium castaneum TaxID=7070 RepID=D6W7Z2_TRICA|nr:PREDICTED: chondroitin sulfate proteoglycan 4 isoform X1 [Tribolium castaneum]EFA11160.2 Chondroitin sulfate proteoglycan 4-like Protein [Tribolium castaneum]|eukprot:XP_008200693.1 PREDICTED: chondroitin sulfate proteoglycan 4 isoform X1 [Tribolium castaneum]